MFECAYFVLRNGPKYDSSSEDDMIAEADRIISESGQLKDKKTDKNDGKEAKNYKKFVLPFSVGALAGSLFGLIWLFF